MFELPRLQACMPCPAICAGCRAEMHKEALRQAPGIPVVLLRPANVKVRAIRATALAYTVTHILVEWDGSSGYHLRWEASWLIRRFPQ
jgi:hypothetical protein